MPVNNAGVEISSLVVDVEPTDIRTMLEVNVLGTLLGRKHGLRAMRPGGAAGAGGAGGSIINISSVATTIAVPGISCYSATRRRPADHRGRHSGRRRHGFLGGQDTSASDDPR